MACKPDFESRGPGVERLCPFCAQSALAGMKKRHNALKKRCSASQNSAMRLENAKIEMKERLTDER